MYRVVHNGHIVAAFSSFLDAWLYVYLELDSYARIYGPDGEWSVNPGRYTVN